MGPIQETGKVATGVIEALKNHPMVLGMVIMNVLFIAMASWLFSAASVRRDELIAKLVTKVATCTCPRGFE